MDESTPPPKGALPLVELVDILPLGSVVIAAYAVRQRGEVLERRFHDGPREAVMVGCLLFWLLKYNLFDRGVDSVPKHSGNATSN